MTAPESLDCDLLVLGAGMAGLSAAGFAAQRYGIGYAGGLALALAYGIQAVRSAGLGAD
jgi:succinate dehydrogenase/fumarate reductase flavoprotein subunit